MPRPFPLCLMAKTKPELQDNLNMWVERHNRAISAYLLNVFGLATPMPLDMGRLDGGTLSGWLYELSERVGLNPDTGEFFSKEG